MGLFTRPAHYPAAGAALPAADGGADPAVAHTADAEIQCRHRPDSGAVCVVPLLPADAVSPAAGGVHRPVHGETGGLPSEPKNRYAVDRPRGAVSAGDHQRPASAGIRLQKRRSRAAALRNVFPPPAVFCLPWLDSGLHGLLPRLPVSKEPYAGRQREADHAVCAGLRDVPVRYSLSVGPSRRPVVVRRYERDVLPAVCRHLRKLYPLSDDTVQHGICGTV